MAGLVPGTIVLALGVRVLGGLDALRLLLESAGRSPLLDILTCVLAMAVATAHVLGTVLLARFVSKERAGGGGAAADPFVRMTATVSAGVASFAAVCLALDYSAKDPTGGISARRSLLAEVPVAVAAVVGAVLLARFSRRRARNAGGAAAPAPATDDTRRFPKLTRGTSLALAAVAFALASLIAIPFAT